MFKEIDLILSLIRYLATTACWSRSHKNWFFDILPGLNTGDPDEQSLAQLPACEDRVEVFVNHNAFPKIFKKCSIGLRSLRLSPCAMGVYSNPRKKNKGRVEAVKGRALLSVEKN